MEAKDFYTNGTTLTANQIKEEFSNMFKKLSDPEFIKRQFEEEKRINEELNKEWNKFSEKYLTKKYK